MEIFNLGWNFNSLNQVEISSRLNSKLLFKMTLQLHVKISTRYTALKFQLGLVNPGNFNPGWKFQIFHIIEIFPTVMKIWCYARVNSLFILQKINMATSQARFKWTDDKPINLIKCLQELDSSYVKLSCLNIYGFQWPQWFKVIIAT